MDSIIEVYKKKDAKKTFDFFAGEKWIASVEYPKRFSKTATVTIGNKQWQIARTGFWKHYFEISSNQSPYSKWKIQQGWRTPVSLRSDDNQLFTFKKKGFWKSDWHWLNEKNESSIVLHACSWPAKKRGTITILEKEDPTSIWLSVIGYFMVLCAQEDAAAAAAA